MNLSNRVELVGITFIGIPTEAPMHFRPYQSNLNGETLNQLETMTNGGVNIGTEVFSDISGRILAPSSQAKGIIDIPYGWNERRYSVIMLFDVHTAFGTQREIITGYTGYAGISHSDALDPQMPIYINSHTIARSKDVVVNNVRQSTYSSGGSMQVLSPITVGGYDGGIVEADTIMRPADVFAYQQRAETNLQNPETVDTRSIMEVGYTPSRKVNTIGSRYISNICRGYKTTLANNLESSDEAGFIAGSAASSPTVAETSIHSSVLFSQLRDRTAFGQSGMVTVSELMAVWPETINDPNRRQVIIPNAQLPVDKTNSVQGWGGNNTETGVAYSLCQSVPALMAELLFVTFSFAMDNRTNLDGSINVVVTGAEFVADVIDGTQRIQTMELSLASDIASQILSRGVSDFAVTMSCNIIGSNEVSVSINGGAAVPYSAPSYCDAAYTPVVTDTTNSLASLATDMSQLITAVFTGDQHTPLSVDSQQGIALY